MQCSQPYGGTGYPSYFGQPCQCNFAFPSMQQPSFYPEVIGEGEVVSVAFPDGSVHMYFIPLNKRPQFAPTNYMPCNNIMGAYYVRGIFPMSSALFNQQCQKMHTGQYSRPCYIPNCSSNIQPPAFQLKFHNDCWTSTTDLHYFCPAPHRTDWLPLTQPKRCATVQIQVDTPVSESTECHPRVCSKPCLCSQGKEKMACESVEECHCMKYVRSDNSIVSRRKKESKLSKKSSKKKLKKKKSDEVCECNEANTTDKAVATFAEQASGCAGAERVTQTDKSLACGTSSAISNVKTELWIPKTSFAKTMQAKSSEKILGLYETRSSDSCCCSEAEMNGCSSK